MNLNVKEDVKKGKNESKSATELLTAKCAENYPLTKIREAGLHRSWPAVQRKAGVTQEPRSTSQREGGRRLRERGLHTHTDTDGEVAEVHAVCWTWPETAQGCAATATATRDGQEHGARPTTHSRRKATVCAHIHHTDCMTATEWAAGLREMRGPGQPPPLPTRSSPHPSAPIQGSAITRFPSMPCHNGYEVPRGQ